MRRCPRVKKIYCLNRSADAREKQTAASQQRGLAMDWEARQVEFLHADLSKPLLGLDTDRYQALLAEVTDIIHNQWPVNFNWDLTSFEPSIAGVRRLIDFALASKHGASLAYVSSVAVVHNLPPSPGAAAAEALLRVPLPAVDGYVASKHVSEMLLERAACRSGSRASICRLGQIAGPVGAEYRQQGMWPKHEWFPTVRRFPPAQPSSLGACFLRTKPGRPKILTSSRYLGLLPAEMGPIRLIDWIPVDVAASVMADLAGLATPAEDLGSGTTVPAKSEGGGVPNANGHAPPSVYHVSSPAAVEWTALAPVVARRLGASVRMVSWGEWMDALRRSGRHVPGAKGALQNPALKLLDFLESLSRGAEWPSLAVERALEKSPAMARLEPEYCGWINTWMDQWGF
ncbi:nrps-like enzyme protein [Apiospora marii]|uniref:Nrps-like enzyme protein n=1 Tax=Apiospora marii TaxID=335849 RepID=A0ABR1RZM0_9PEZI